ncbi:MAG: hypothetical protein O7F73_10310, partial [Gammaproteobacteria bacterium]|nr:hypothetical protein [Gammaproteobacteria bacterium]
CLVFASDLIAWNPGHTGARGNLGGGGGPGGGGGGGGPQFKRRPLAQVHQLLLTIGATIKAVLRRQLFDLCESVVERCDHGVG